MENWKNVIHHIAWNNYQPVYGERRLKLIIGKQQPRAEIYNNHDLAMSCIDDGFSVFLTTHITVICFPSNCRDPDAQGSLQDYCLYLEWKKPSSREDKGRWDKSLILHQWTILTSTENETHYQISIEKTYRRLLV